MPMRRVVPSCCLLWMLLGLGFSSGCSSPPKGRAGGFSIQEFVSIATAVAHDFFPDDVYGDATEIRVTVEWPGKTQKFNIPGEAPGPVVPHDTPGLRLFIYEWTGDAARLRATATHPPVGGPLELWMLRTGDGWKLGNTPVEGEDW